MSHRYSDDDSPHSSEFWDEREPECLEPWRVSCNWCPCADDCGWYEEEPPNAD